MEKNRVMRGVRRLAYLFVLAYAMLLDGAVWHYLRSSDARASVDIDFKTLLLFVVVIIMVVIGAAIYFTITTPQGQSGLAGIGQAIANAIASPFIALGNGIGTVFSSLFNGVGNALSHIL
jgi:hypothetical protein